MFLSGCSNSSVSPSGNPLSAKVGEKAAEFELSDQYGDPWSLSRIVEEKRFTAIVFFRSADWWIFCKTQLVELQNQLIDIESAEIQIVGISYDDVSILRDFTRENNIAFPLLSDKESKTIRAYGIFDSKEKGIYSGVPIPTTVIVDQAGMIRAVLPGTQKKRHSIDQLLTAMKSI